MEGGGEAESTSNFSNLVSECLPKHLECLDVICCEKKQNIYIYTHTHRERGVRYEHCDSYFVKFVVTQVF